MDESVHHGSIGRTGLAQQRCTAQHAQAVPACWIGKAKRPWKGCGCLKSAGGVRERGQAPAPALAALQAQVRRPGRRPPPPCLL